MTASLFALAWALLATPALAQDDQGGDTGLPTAEERPLTSDDVPPEQEQQQPAAQTAPADATMSPPAGTFGLGGEGFLSGLIGLHGRYQITDRFGLSAAFRLGLGVLTTDMLEDTTGFELGAGIGAWLTLLEFTRGRAGLIGTFDFDIRHFSGLLDQTDFDFGIGVGLFAELFLAPFFSLHGQAGLRMTIGDREGTNDAAVSVGLGGDGFAGFGFTIWFI